MKAEISRLWPASLNTHCPPGVCVPCVAFVLECEVSRDSAVEENEVQLEIPRDAALARVSGSIETLIANCSLHSTFHISTDSPHSCFLPTVA